MFKLFASCAAMIVALGVTASAETLVERGSYLVNAVMGCDGCHTPRPGGVFDLSKRFSGGSQVWDETAYTVRGSNITPDPETGIGSWSEADIKRALTEGVRPSGVPLAPQMPFAFYKILTPRDLDAVAAYIKSVAPVRNQVPPPVYKAAMHAELIPDGEKPIAEEALRDPVKRGFYLATIAHCMECHARRPDGTQDHVNWNGKGGYTFKGPFGEVVARNISSHKTTGIGAWSADARHRPRRPRVQAADGAPSLFQQDDRRRRRRNRRLGADHSANRMRRQCSFGFELQGVS
jgi:mono/diheme cytochrome c family protein